ncbi:Uncharacterized N-terminal domain of lipid-A-disaccharide synthase [Fulvimarina manganoxydans]|uniref:Uncharacterized N-terminal domain of lipid-A-disaccharide synthase n=1 Tax=Fulvimarina manganoxydans TaxID=937218 RepID=A0A1W2DIQ9_9HYPH|nr:lipid-A-disaccharide synthase N-terminal domain-containing protein [Fulvimarina manganoxydans]SMC96878.1 Uncharacterized N-terminal domain of lipid-A-disaccharide synthase [Fulvimarina manganoxydans]
MIDAILRFIDEAFSSVSDVWLILGFVAQAMFTARFLVQWVASERARRSVVPVAFWSFSLAGGSLLLLYAIHRRDPVFITGQAAGLIIYVRNLMLIRAERKRDRAEPPRMS